MKKILIAVSLLLPVILQAQGERITISGTTSTLPRGTYLQNGQIRLSKGYRYVYSEDKKTVSVALVNTSGSGGPGAISGTFSCFCMTEGAPVEDDCTVTIFAETIRCKSQQLKCSNCELATTINSLSVKPTSKEPKDPNVTWKRFVFPEKKY